MQQRLVKTALGQQAFKERSALLAGKLRSAFLMFDGQRTVLDVLEATKGLGVTMDDVQTMLSAQLLENTEPVAVRSVPAAKPASDRSAQERYSAAYPLAVALTGKLGLSGFRLNLSVEGSTSFQDLAAIAPKIKEVVSAQDYAKLEKALFE